jgi:protein-disulfide isomerase
MPRLSRLLVVAACLAAACTRTASTSRDAGGSVSSASGTIALAQDTLSQRADRGRILGDSTAKLWVIMASDFQCPYCKQWHDAKFSQLMKDYVSTGRIRLGFINFPLSQHQNAMPAAEAGMCAAAQNKFLPMHEALFASQPKWETLRNPVPKFDSLAAGVGLNMPAYRECVDKHLTRPLIEADHDRWATAGVQSTPTFFVGGKILQAGADADVAAAVDAALGASSKKK